MKPRIFLAGLFHETNTFADQPTDLEAFQITRDDGLFGFRGNGTPMDGYLEASATLGWETVPGVDYRAAPSGPLTNDVFHQYWAELCPRLESALVKGLDAVFLVLHGAMATPELPDVEGELLKRIRALPGLEQLPVFVVLDLHANVSETMAREATALIPYRENPHTDARETAIRAANLLAGMWLRKKNLRTIYRHARILLAPPSTGSAGEPMRSLRELALGLQEVGGHSEVGIAAGFAHADTPDTGLSFWIVTDRPEAECTDPLDKLCRKAMELARKFRPMEVDLSAAIKRIREERCFPALLVEPADNIGGGAPGDATFILRALLDSPFEHCGVIINDPETVLHLSQFRPGQTVPVNLGGKVGKYDQGPLSLEVLLVKLSNGQFDLEDPRSHLASMFGNRIEMGPCALVTCENMSILVTTHATPPFDLGQWRGQGIDPKALQVIGIKAAVGHRQAYEPIAAASYTVTTPGPCSSDLRSLPYAKLTRPIYPLDDV